MTPAAPRSTRGHLMPRNQAMGRLLLSVKQRSYREPSDRPGGHITRRNREKRRSEGWCIAPPRWGGTARGRATHARLQRMFCPDKTHQARYSSQVPNLNREATALTSVAEQTPHLPRCPALDAGPPSTNKHPPHNSRTKNHHPQIRRAINRPRPHLRSLSRASSVGESNTA